MTDDPTISRKLAVLIDADNASSGSAAGLFEEIARIGEASVRLIYGYLTYTRLQGWARNSAALGLSAASEFREYGR